MKRLLGLLPLTRPHEGRHQTRARDAAAGARPASGLPPLAPGDREAMDARLAALSERPAPPSPGARPLPVRVPGATFLTEPLPERSEP